IILKYLPNIYIIHYTAFQLDLSQINNNQYIAIYTAVYKNKEGASLFLRHPLYIYICVIIS
ncbi:hypothetical protein CLV42_1011, partial [Chitinophaga ginsengisoli]